MKNNNAILLGQTPGRQSGMTLIELAVVLLVLVGLGGLLIPYVTGYVDKTHDATGVGSMTELSGAISRFEVEKGRYPINMDSMIDGAGTNAGTVIDYFMTGAPATAYGFTALNLGDAANTDVCAAIRTAGITSVLDMKASNAVPFNATFDNAETAPIAIPADCANITLTEIDAGKVETVTGIDACNGNLDANGLCAAPSTPNGRYVAFGIGQRADMVGVTMTDAPVHFAKQAAMNAAKKYNRFAAIFQVDNNTANGDSSMSRARFVGSAMLMMGITGKESDLKNWYNAANN